MDRIGPFLPILDKLVSKGPSPFVALLLLNLLEVAPRAEQLNMLVGAVCVWLEVYPDFQQLWIDYGVGRRWCLVMEAILGRSPCSFSSAPLRRHRQLRRITCRARCTRGRTAGGGTWQALNY